MKRLLRLFNRLTVRMVLPFAVALIAVLGVTTFFLGRTVRAEGLRELNERASLLAETLAYNAELPLLARDSEALRTLLEGARRDPDLLEASVFDSEGRALARFTAGAPSSAVPRTMQKGSIFLTALIRTEGSPAAGGDSAAFVLDEPRGKPGTPIGRVRLTISTDRTVARTRRLQSQIAGAGAGLLLLCVGIGFGVVRIIGTPLRELVSATRRVSQGDLSVRVTPSTADEIGELGVAFNRMAADLDVTRSELEAERSALERRVEERTAALQRAQETLLHSEKMKAVGQLVAGVAHELNNPLTVVLGYAGLLRQQTADAATQRKLDLLAGEAERCQKIVQNLLTFARKQKHERGMVDVNDAITRTVGLRAYQLRGENIEVVTDLVKGLPATWADVSQLQQVVLNLIVNAEQAIQDAGKGSRIRIATRQAEGRIEIEVEDDGPGIPPGLRSKIFEPFFTTKPVGRGTGLGLSICYGIVEAHGGSVDVESEPGRGTTFRLKIPIAARPANSPEAGAAAPAGRAPAVPARARQVLVIDDDPAVLQFVGDAFAGLPIRVESAMGGRDGIARLASGRAFDLILADIRMPDVDGRAVFLYIREKRPELENKLVFATGDVANAESADFLKRTGRPILEKPFTVDALREMVTRLSN
ncbi:MAG TPA: ATP-binding protein [Candidatus Polarisedimenticolia bacterium]|jgi:signal transduction histidine kinase|nr:ATP-binding protein [Candidatus Polarisedimenticolia bacterium]